jgi:hypothetical protein
MSGRGRIVETRAAVSAAGGADAVAAVAALAMPILQARQLIEALALTPRTPGPGRPRPLPDDADTLRKWLAAIPSAAEIDATIAALARALTVPATRDQAHALIATMIDGMGRASTEGTATYVAAVAATACEPDDWPTDNDESDWTKPKWGPVSPQVMALAVRRIWREAKFLAPCEFRDACLLVRSRVRALHYELRQIAEDKIMLRIELQHALTCHSMDSMMMRSLRGFRPAGMLARFDAAKNAGKANRGAAATSIRR